MRYKDRGSTEATWRLPGREARENRSKVSQRYGTAVTDSLLMTGRDRLHFKRWGEAFLRPGLARTDSWVYGDNSIAWGIVQTRSDRAGSPEELSIYVVEGYWMGRSLNVRRYTPPHGRIRLRAGAIGRWRDGDPSASLRRQAAAPQLFHLGQRAESGSSSRTRTAIRWRGSARRMRMKSLEIRSKGW